MHIAERTTKDTACCAAGDSLEMAANLLWQNDCGCIPVVNESGQAHGVITDRDICMAALTTGKRLAELFVVDAMANGLTNIGPTDSLLEAEMAMRSREDHDLPGTDAQHRVRMLCCNDLLGSRDDDGADGLNPNDAVQMVHALATFGIPHAANRESCDGQPAPTHSQ